jgi:5'-3' exonuclease
MGIRNLHKFLKRHAPQVYREIPISEYKKKSIAIDINVYLYKFKSLNSVHWYASFYKLISTLRKYEIDCVFVYDTKAPAEKYTKIQERKSKRKQTESRIQDIKMALDVFKNSGSVDNVLLNVMGKRMCSNRTGMPSLLTPTNPTNVTIDVQTIESEIVSLQNQIINITRDDIALSKTILRYMNIPFFDSDNEAETMCSHLCFHDQMDAVLSDDTDVLVYGTPIFLTRFNIMQGTVTEIRYAEVLKALDMTPETFRDFCILSGTDYNKNIFRIGHEKAFKLLKDFPSIELIRDNMNMDVSILNHERVREIFSISPKNTSLELKCGEPDMAGLALYVIENNLKLTL